MSAEITHRQHVARFNAQSDTIVAEVVRTARLDETLSTIKSRRFDCIALETVPFSGTGRTGGVLYFSRDGAAALRDALNAALDATEGDPTIWVRDEDVAP